jgi:hypothetical protein
MLKIAISLQLRFITKLYLVKTYLYLIVTMKLVIIITF